LDDWNHIIERDPAYFKYKTQKKMKTSAREVEGLRKKEAARKKGLREAAKNEAEKERP